MAIEPASVAIVESRITWCSLGTPVVLLCRALLEQWHGDAGGGKTVGVEHTAINLATGERVDGPWHIQNANSYHNRLKGWMQNSRA